MVGPTIAFIAALLLMALGVAGIFLPFLPGVPLAWLGLATFSIATGFAYIGMPTLIVFLVLTILASALDFVAPMIGAKRRHASRYGILGSMLGLMIGVFVVGPVGIVVGPIVGAFLGELLSGKTRGEAGSAAFGAFIGFAVGSLLKLTLILIMLGFLIASLF